MSYEFRDHIRVGGIATVNGLNCQGPHVMSLKDVEKENPETDLSDPFVYEVAPEDYFLAVQQNHSSTGGVSVHIKLPIAGFNKGRIIWAWDASLNADNLNIVFTDQNDNAISTISDAGHLGQVFCDGDEWHFMFGHEIASTA